jgi:CRISPR-associated protein Cas2
MFVWVMYDISSDRDRGKIAKACKEYGLIRVQYSVFFGNIPTHCLDEIAEFSRELIDPETDGVFILPVSEDYFRKKKIVGKSFNESFATGQISSFML